MGESFHPVEAPFFHPVKWAGRNPGPFIVTPRDLPIPADPNSIRGTKTSRENFQLLSVLADLILGSLRVLLIC